MQGTALEQFMVPKAWLGCTLGAWQAIKGAAQHIMAASSGVCSAGLLNL